jgi:hypothetical protein
VKNRLNVGLQDVFQQWRQNGLVARSVGGK